MGASQIMDVIVIGLGASGVAAVRKLHDAGLKVLGLEAADRIGGRILSVEFGGCWTDLGAAWCHGEKDNIVFELANGHNLLGRPSGPDNKWFVLSNGEILSQETAEVIVNILENEVAKADKNNAVSISECVRNVSKTNSTLQKDPNLSNSFVEWFERNNHVGGQVEAKAGKSLRGLVENWPCEGEPMLNWKGKGYKTILDILLNKYPDPSQEVQLELLLNKEVNSIRWGTNKLSADDVNPLVQVKCKDGSLYAAKSVLVTMSIGVLKERHAELFSPSLPSTKIEAINNLQLCVLDKIYIEFEKPWWKHPSNFAIIWRDEDKKTFAEDESWITEIYGIWTVENEPNLLLAWIYGEGAKVMENKSNDEVRAGVKKLIDTVLKKQFDVSPMKSILRSQWASNPLIRGAYSYRSQVSEENGGDAITLSEPLYRGANNFPIVCFGGEATSHRRHNGVHGAIEAGFREANRLIENIRKLQQ